MTRTAFRHSVPVELTADPRMQRRVRRLGYVSLVALGLIWGLAVTTLSAPVGVSLALAGGWVLMPLTLMASLSWPRLRYGLAVPAGLVGGGLLAICLWWLPADPIASAGWLMLTFGVLLGGVLGTWFWFRWLRVPGWLDDPECPGRWSLIAVHVALIVIGWGLAGSLLIRG